MKFLIDANLPPGLATWLHQHTYEAIHVSDQPGLNLDDRAIFAVVWLRLGNATNARLQSWLRPLIPQIVDRLAAGETLVEVV